VDLLHPRGKGWVAEREHRGGERCGAPWVLKGRLGVGGGDGYFFM